MRRRFIPVLVAAWIAFASSAPAASALELPEGYQAGESGVCRVAVPERNRALIDELLEVCQATYPRMARQLGLSEGAAGGTIEIRVVRDPSEMGDVAPAGASPPEWSGAIAYPDAGMIVLALNNRIGAPVEDLGTVLEHELSHFALRRAIGDAAVPRWFSEGIAIQQSERSSIRRFWLVWLAARGGSLLPLESIERYPDEPHQINLAYAQAADFVGFLIRREGWLGVRIALREMAGEGAPFEEAFDEAFRDSPGSLESAWRAGLESRWDLLPLVTGTGVIWGGIAVLFLVAYVAARRRKKRRLAEMEAEEELIDRLVDLNVSAPKERLRPVSAEPLPSKIRVDGEIHTLH
jgi:hypothetical protein